ncbi:hypothetical protein [Tepidibacter hydrothermalis]|uniref:Uncharacterized protein n=1 Tax=Tepidibacter hydrothermalis TaxID=3036126 RepID=A0ABY8EK83_9FIRM|nr:hypothetical protein [Tepidibacter hydrothermalis]WFD11473.1 hypothetical protein P4S50_05195 [Tepidibacter hydrothermalis]
MNYKILSKQEAFNEITKKDDFIQAVNIFEMMMKMSSHSEVTMHQYIKHLGTTVQEWEVYEKNKLEFILDLCNAAIEKKMSNIHLKINLAKTDGRDEYNSAYTRGNTIYLPPNKIKYETNRLVRLILHEIFHIITRTNRMLKKSIYSLIGYELINPIELSKKLDILYLVNPDCPFIDSFRVVRRNGVKCNVSPIITLNKNLSEIDTSVDIFKSIELKYIEIIEEAGVYSSGSILYDITELNVEENEKAFLLNQPEEILAEEFVSFILGEVTKIDFDKVFK